MSTYSVADARAQLPKLIDRALAGEEVVISRHGKAVVEIRPAQVPDITVARASYEWFRSRRLTLMGGELSSVEILNQMYDDPPC